MNCYICFYLSKQIVVHAETSYAAQQEAQRKFQIEFPRRKVKGYDISTVPTEIDGKEIIHKPLF
jgi:hypothetical protein